MLTKLWSGRFEESSLDSQEGTGDFSFLHSLQTGSGAHPTAYPVGTGIYFPPGGGGLKRSGRETHHSICGSAETVNARSFTSAPSYIFITGCSVEHRDNFAFLDVIKISFGRLRLDVLMIVALNTGVCWYVTAFSLLGGYQCFRRISILRFQTRKMIYLKSCHGSFLDDVSKATQNIGQDSVRVKIRIGHSRIKVSTR
jgi:hypothetical protein